MLTLIATPIGDFDEISLKALRILREADIVICESTKETSRLLKHHEIKAKQYELLNEHTVDKDLRSLVQLCKEKNVALVSDCGTPGFHDPGADLVELCRKNGIEVRNVLGPSALMGLLALCGLQLKEFVFRGFLPAENEERSKELKKLAVEKRALILMDTPYRLQKLLSEMKLHLHDREFVLALNLSTPEEKILVGTMDQIQSSSVPDKAEFMLLVKPHARTTTR